MSDDKEVKRVEPPAAEEDDRALSESQALAGGEDLARDREERAHNRREAGLDLLFSVVRIFVVLGAALVCAGLIAWAWHFIGPAEYQWLTGPQLAKLETVLFSALLAAFLSEQARKLF